MSEELEKSGDKDDAERKRRKIFDPDNKIGDKLKKKPGGCVGAVIIGAVTLMVAICSGLLSLLPGCRLEWRKPWPFQQPAEQVEEFDDSGIQSAGLGMMTQVAYNDHERNQAGLLLKSYATGPGYQINWISPTHPNGAKLEQVLDAALSRMQALQKSPKGGNELAKHIYALDKLVNELRQSDFSDSGFANPQETGPGFVPPPQPGGIGGVGSANPTDNDSESSSS